MWFAKLFVKYIYALGRGALYELRPYIDAFNQKRREICILHIVLCGIMGPTNGKTLFTFRIADKSGAFIHCCFTVRTKSENLQIISWAISNMGLVSPFVHVKNN